LSYIAAGWIGDTNHYSMGYGNHLIFGSPLAAYQTLGQALRPEEVWNIDTKIDDGRPGRGRLILTYWTFCTYSTSDTDFDKDYNLTVTTPMCAFRFRNVF
jgi:hypothetical protein